MASIKIICNVCGKEMFKKEKNEKNLLDKQTEITCSNRVVSTSSTNLSILRDYILDYAKPTKEIKIVTYICSDPDCGATKQVRAMP